MERIFKRIKNRFQQLKKPTENTKEKTQEILKLLLWIFGVYACINLLPFINKLLINLPSGLFLVLLLNCVFIFWFLFKSYYDILAIRRALLEKNANKLIINLIYTINQFLFIGFNIYILYV